LPDRTVGNLKEQTAQGCAVAEALVEAIVVSKAEHRGARWRPDRLKVVWRS